jgi:hypothetical protein
MPSQALIASLAAIRAGLAVLRARTPGTPAGDVDDPDESNSFDLPEGAPIRKRVKAFARRQLRKILGTLPEIGAPIPDAFPSLANWDDPMASAMTPLISAYWDEAGKTTRARLGLDPDRWEVHDPHLHDKVKSAALSFCKATNETTDLELGEALARLRGELSAGLVDAGDSIPELTDRVQSVFARLSTGRAERIARTEAARAVHAASLESARESGVVAGKKWLVSAGSCDRCRAVAAEHNRGIGLDQPFVTEAGKNPDYATVQHPPLHPSCRCSLTLVLTDEYEALLAGEGPPEPTFEPGALGPEPKARIVAKMAKAGPHDDLPRYGPADARIVEPAGRKSRRAVSLAAREIFGKRRGLKQLASVIGAPDGSEVTIKGYPGSARLFYRVAHPDLEDFHGWIEREGGDVVHEFARIAVVEEKRDRGVATAVHGRMVEQGARLGVRRLKLDAARTEDDTGYTFWPGRGYDGPLPERIIARLPAGLKGARTLRDLHVSDEGRDWWEYHGETIPLTFDLSPGSPDRGRWIHYWRALGGERRRTMTREERLALVPYPNVQGATPGEVVDALDILVAYNRKLREEGGKQPAGRRSTVGDPGSTGPADRP